MANTVSEIKILLVDGDLPMVSLLQEYLKRLGYEVVTARDGREAVDIARKQKPHLIILETLLPEMGGLEVCRLLKSDDATRDALIIFLSADDSIDNKVEALTSGAHDFLGKPFSPRELEVRIAAALHNRRLKPAELTPMTADKGIYRGRVSVRATTPAQSTAKRHLQVFLCHSSSDKSAVRGLYNRLRSAADYISPWLDEENLLPGQKWQDEIPKAVRESDVVIVCLSQNSINRRGYVQKEIKYALDVADEQPEGTIFLIPVRLEDCEIPERLKHLHCVNLNESRGFEQLIRALNVRAEKLGIAGGASSIKHDLIDEKSGQARVTQLRQELLASYPGDREKAARQLGRLGPAASVAVPTLIKKLKDPSGPVRDAAAWALREIGTEQALDAVTHYENK